jgi:flagellin-like protein
MERGQKNLTLDFVPRDVKGISNIIVTLIMVVLVLVAVGIVWASIQSNLQSGTESFDLNTKCLGISVSPIALNCGADKKCSVTVERSAGGEAFSGLKLIYTTAEVADGNYVQTTEENIPPLEIKTLPQSGDTGLIDVINVEVLPYFIDGSGKDQICPN